MSLDVAFALAAVLRALSGSIRRVGSKGSTVSWGGLDDLQLLLDFIQPQADVPVCGIVAPCCLAFLDGVKETCARVAYGLPAEGAHLLLCGEHLLRLRGSFAPPVTRQALFAEWRDTLNECLVAVRWLACGGLDVSNAL